MIKFQLSSYDILFFGSGKPFNENVSEAISVFPPFPNTLASCICGKIYSHKKIKINKIIKKVYGPFIEKREEILFPKPLDILKEKKKEFGEISCVDLVSKFSLINPSFCDHEKLKFLLWQRERNKDFETFEAYIKLEGLENWLANKKIDIDDLVEKSDIFLYESRIGIKMDYSKNTTESEDGLYKIDFARVREDVKIVFFVEFDFGNEELKKCGLETEEKILDFFNEGIKVLKLGGEMRCVSYECKINEFNFFETPSVEEGDIIKILYLTPGFLEDNPAYEIINASIKPINLGIHSKHSGYGIKLKKGICAGSVIYAIVKDKEKLKDIWLNPKNGEFIGANLMIYTKYKPEGEDV